MSTEIENALGAMGFEITSGEVAEGTSLDAPSFEPPQGAEVLDFSGIANEPAAELTPEPTADIQAPVTPEPEAQPEPVVAQSSLNTNPEPEMSEQEFEAAIASYVSERLGVSVDSLEQLAAFLEAQQTPSIDERVKAIADFVEETGRDPYDWFRYQSINPSEMDDLSAVKMQLAVDYPNLSNEDINLLVASKYKVDEDIYSDDEVRLAKIQLKIDADKAKRDIEKLRENYRMPVKREEPTQAEVQSPIDESWIRTMSQEVDALEALTFDLNGQEFNFGLNDQYKSSLKDKNARLDEFFDQYVDESGSWDFETLNAHRALLDNIDEIASAIYKQGLSDGQRKLVETAANVDVTSPRVAETKNADSVAAQIFNYLNSNDGLRLKI
jgi:hypothetical protein